MRIDEEMLMAHADGTLDAAEAARVEAAIAADPALAARVARHRALRERVAAAYAGTLDEPVPERLRSLLQAPPHDAGVARLREARAAGGRRWSAREWLAMAAALALGVALARLLPPQLASPAMIDAEMSARGALADALDRGLSGERAASPAVAVGLSFRQRDGGYCRGFRIRAAAPLAGLACRDGDAWRVTVLAEAAAVPAGDLRPAAADLPPAVLGEIDARIDGEPLDAAAERAARDAGWR